MIRRFEYTPKIILVISFCIAEFKYTYIDSYGKKSSTVKYNHTFLLFLCAIMFLKQSKQG
jgi:hypothetical protein